MPNYTYKNKNFSEEQVLKAAETANLSFNDYVDKHKISRIEDDVDPSVSLQNVRDKKIPEFKSTQISLEDINVDRGEGLFGGALNLGVEANIYKNLKDHYKGAGVTFKEANVGKDAIEVKNKAGDIETFLIPSGWNKNRIGNPFEMIVSPILGQDNSGGTMEDFHKKITDFIAVGNKNIDTGLDTQQRNIEYEILQNLDNNDIIKSIIPDFTGNWEAVEAGDDKEKKDLISGIFKQIGGNDVGVFGKFLEGDYSKLNETDYQYALDKLITLKATEYTKEKTRLGLIESQKILGDEYSIKNIQEDGDAVVYRNFNQAEKNLADLFSKYEKLEGDDSNGAKQKRKDIFEEMRLARAAVNNASGLFYIRNKEAFVLDSNGNYVDPVRHGSGEQIQVSVEEFEKNKEYLKTKTKGERGKVRELSNVNHEKLYVSGKQGEKIESVVINDKSVFKSLVADHNLKPVGKTKNGFIFEIPRSLAAHNYNYMVKGDGYDMWKDFMENGEASAVRQSAYYNALKDANEDGEAQFPDFNSPDGHFGLLEFDENQTFEGVEKSLGVDLRNNLGISWWDQDEYADNDLSKQFKRELKGWRDQRKGLVSDRKILNDMHILNIDPGSNELSFKVDLNEDVEGESTFSLDFIPQGFGLLYDGFGSTLGFDADVKEDLNIWSARASNDALESFSSNNGFELNEEQEERVKRTGAYKVFEGVVGFVPAITEFALIEAATAGFGTATGITRLLEKSVKSYKVGEKGVTLTARQMAKRIGYKGPIGSKKFDDAIQVYNTKRRLTGSKRIVSSLATMSTQQKALFHGFKVLKEEAKMAIAFEDDYKIGMGAGFYVVGAGLPRFKFGRDSAFGQRAVGTLNVGLTLGRSGLAGAAGSLGASNLEAFVEDLRGNTTYGKYLSEEYSDLSETGQQGLIDFFTFMLVSRGKGISRYNFKSIGKLDLLETQSRKIVETLREQEKTNTGRFKSDPEAWQKSLDKYTEMNISVARVIDTFDANTGYDDPVLKKKIVTRQAENALVVIKQMKGFEKTKIIVQDGQKGFENKGAPAEFSSDKKTIRLDLSKIDRGALPHEMGHLVFKALFKSNPEMSRIFASKLKSSFTGTIGKYEVNEFKNGELVGTGKFKEMTLDEFIENSYKQRKDFEKIKDEEYVMYVIELLSNGKYYTRLVENGVFTNLKQTVNRFANERTGEDAKIFGKKLFKEQDTKQQLINFLANFATSIQKGSLTLKQVEKFEKFGLELGQTTGLDMRKVKGKKTVDISDLYKESISKDSRTESEKSTAKATNQIKRDQIEDIYMSKVSNLKGEDKRKAIEDFLMGKSAKKGTPAYEFEIRRQNPKADNAKIKELIEKGQNRLQTEAHFDRIVGNALELKYPDLKFAEKQALFNQLKFDPYVIGKGGKEVKKRGVVEAIMDYRKGEHKDLASWVMGNLLGSPETGGFSRMHEIISGKRRGGAVGNIEIPGMFRKSITEEKGVGIREKDLGTTTQAEQASAKTPYTGRKIKIAEELKLKIEDLEAGKKVIGEFIEQAPLKNFTYKNIGKEVMPILRPIIEAHFGRTAEFYKEKAKGEKKKSDGYKKIIKNTRNVLFEDALTLHKSIPEQMSEMAAEVTGAMQTFGPLFTSTGRRINFAEMPVWMGLSKSKKAEGPLVFEKIPADPNLIKAKRAFLDFMYKNPKTGKPLTTAQVETRVERLIDFATISTGVQLAKDLVATPGYREMILQKESAGAIIGREKLMKLDEQNVIDKVQAQVRDALPQALATKGITNTKAYERYVDYFASENLNYDMKNMLKAQSENYEFQNLDIKLFYNNVLKPLGLSKGEINFDAFLAKDLIINPKNRSKKPVNQIEEWKSFPELMKSLGIEGSENVITSTAKQMKSKDFINDYYKSEIGMLRKVASVLPQSMVESSHFKATFNQGNDGAAPRVGNLQRQTPNKDGKMVNRGINATAFKKLMKDGNIKGIPDAKYLKSIEDPVERAEVKKALKNFKIVDNGVFKTFIVKELAKKEYADILNLPLKQQKLKAVVRKYLGLDKGAEAANQKVLELMTNSVKDFYNGAENKTTALNQVVFHLATQTNIGRGFYRGGATHMDISMEAQAVGKMLRSEHGLQLINFNTNFLVDVLQHGKNPDVYRKNYAEYAKMYRQGVITETVRKSVDESYIDGVKVITNTKIPKELTFDHPAAATYLKTMEIADKQLYLGEGQLTRGQQISYNIAMGNIGTLGKSSSFALPTKGISKKQQYKNLSTAEKAIALGRLKDKKKRGMSTFDFDETVGVSQNYVFARKGKETKKIASNEWPFVGDKLLAEGWKMDFTDFNKVTDGKPGPLMQKMKNQIKKFGPDNVFILTARAPESQKAIHDYLKSEGIKIPLKNITGLGNSTGEAKAMWMLEKFSEGYNDMYFVDDAMPNVKAVREVLDQLDIKSKVQQALPTRSILSKRFNTIVEDIYGIGAQKEFSTAKGQLLGQGKRTRSLVTPANQDFAGLLQNFVGKSKQGEKHQEFFNETLHKPFSRAYNNINSAKEATVTDFKALAKNFPQVKKNLSKKIPGSPWTFDHAVRVHRWTEAGFKIPDLSKKDIIDLNKVVKRDADLLEFSQQLSKLTKQEKGYTKPGASWLSSSIMGDLQNIVTKVNRKIELAEFIENRESIFGVWNNGKLEGPNMNKIERTQGPKFREALEDILWRMETGSNRPSGKNAVTNAHMDFINGAVGTTMFLNTRSALLQGLSTFNYINWKDNNPLEAGKAFANQKQYWKDFKYIMNSDMLRQRRGGLKYNVQEAELAQSAAQGRENWKKGDVAGIAKSTIAYMLKKGFLPTQIMDSFAISAGGATFYRNRVNTYLKQGFEQKVAEKKAWLDFQEKTEVSQQSSRPDLISQNQAAPTGRLILAWANTPMQYGRIQEKSVRNFINRRGSDVENLSKISYYGVIQSALFASLQGALFAYALDEEGDMAKGDPQIKESRRLEDALYKRTFRTVNTIIDGQLGGIGIPGKVVSTIKNMALEFHTQDAKEYNKDFSRVGLQAISYSPPIGSKVRALVGAGNIWKWNKDAIVGSPMNLDNPGLMAAAKIIESTTNAPTARALQKIDNLREAADQRNQYWQRVASFFGFASYDIGVKNEEFEEVKKKFKKLRKKNKKNKSKKIKLLDS